MIKNSFYGFFVKLEFSSTFFIYFWFNIKKGNVMFTNFVIRYLETHPSVFNIMCTIRYTLKVQSTGIKHVILIFIYYARVIITKNKSFSKLIQIFGEIFNSAAGHDGMQPFRK